MAIDLKAAYKTIMDDHFTPRMEISFIDGNSRQTLCYEKVSWVIGGEEKGLRYGENPGQEAALYKLVNGNLVLGEVTSLAPGRYLASDPELLQSGKHPGKTNLTDADNALNILRYLDDTPCAVIVKHNNPCGVARSDTLADAYYRANKADRLAAFGGCIALNREVDLETARLIVENYAEVVVAPEFASGVMDLFATKKNLRVMRINNMARLSAFVAQHVVDFKSLIDGGLVAQWSFVPEARTAAQLMPATCTQKDGTEHRIQRLPTPQEYEDLIFGWLVEAGVTSNSVLYVKDGATVGIGTGEQDRVGVAEIARDKAYRKLADWIAWEKHATPYNDLVLKFDEQGRSFMAEIDEEVKARKGGLPGCSMVSDAFFPFRDGAEVGIREGITAIVQPGGAIRDWDVIDCCNDANVAMVFTGQRSFKH
ncbi:MAG TPA: IMP cyclohydrolase [Kiritimatiellia bacterium]|jgi:phosphoribosylaminoimidazolecarboxamide formyltransferase/IMP cyclohydrolase|nr:IMP cyclohydrolase [Kiritimatiellia bacterium]